MTTDHADLIAVLEGAEGPDPKITKMIGEALGWKFLLPSMTWLAPDGEGLQSEHSALPDFSASLDLAVQNVPEGWGWLILTRKEKSEATVFKYGSRQDEGHTTMAATPCLALWAAIFRARMAEGKADD